MRQEKQFLTDPGVHSILRVIFERKSLKLDENSNITGIEKKRLLNWAEKLEENGYVEIKTYPEDIEIKKNKKARKELSKHYENEKKFLEENKNELISDLRSLSVSLNQKKVENEAEIRKIKKKQEKIEKVVKCLKNQNHSKAENLFEKIEHEKAEKLSLPDRKDFQELRISEKFLSKSSELL